MTIHNKLLMDFIIEYTSNKHIILHFIGKFKEPNVPDEQYDHLLGKKAKMVTVGGSIMRIKMLETGEKFDVDLSIDKWSVIDIE